MGRATRAGRFGGLRVLIAGVGVAALETMLALRARAKDLVDIELLSPEPLDIRGSSLDRRAERAKR